MSWPSEVNCGPSAASKPAAHVNRSRVPRILPVSHGPLQSRDHKEEGAYSFKSQPSRNAGFTYLFASGLFVKRRFLASHSSLPGTRNAITASASHSAYGAEMLKSEQPGSPPLQARTQSSMWPGDRVSTCGGST